MTFLLPLGTKGLKKEICQTRIFDRVRTFSSLRKPYECCAELLLICHRTYNLSSSYARFFISNAFFSTQCCLTLSWIELQMLLRYCLIHTTIIILRHILHLVYLCPCLVQGQFMSYLCDPLFIFNLIFIAINHMSVKQT